MEANEQCNSIATTICIIRHGETDWNSTGRLQGREDIELNALGRKQAAQLALYFKREPWDIIVSSPLKRAYETAQIIGSQISIAEIHVYTEIIERCYGSASGLLPEERRNLFPDGIPDQEEFEYLCQRAMAGITKIAGNFQGKKIIVISHGGLINAILYSISGGEFGSFKTRLKNGGISKLIFQNNNWSVVFYNKMTDEIADSADSRTNLYSEAELNTMRIAEEARLPGRNRVEELISYAQKAGIKRIGIANCISLQKEAEQLKTRLAEKFEVYSIDCFIGKISSAKLLGNNAKGVSCNPAGQANYLASNNTELNISFGLCMGHDILFNQRSKAPVTTLIVKDREHRHNPFKEFDDKI